nr:hypothetical protein [Tanacetum cinerariifolium]
MNFFKTPEHATVWCSAAHKLTNEEIRNSKASKEYYAIATVEAAPKPKASVRRTRSISNTSITPPTAAASPRLTASTKGKQTAKASKAKSLSALSEVAMTEAQQLKLVTKRIMQQTHISQLSGLGADERTGCSLLRKKLEEDLVTYFQDFQNTSESFDDSTNVVNALREPFVVEQDHGVNSSQNPPHIDECCCECGDALDGIFCQRCTCPHGNFQYQPLNYYEPNMSYDSNYSGFDQFGNFHPQQYLSCENCGGPHETFHCQPPQYTVNHPIFNAHNDLLNSQTTLMEQMTTFTSMCEMVCQIVQKKQEEKQIEEEQAANARYWKIPACCDDDDDYNSAITPVLSIEEPDNSLSMRDEHLETILATESDKVIKSSVKYLVSILSEFEGIPDTMCDVHLVNNPTLFEVKDHCEISINSHDDISSSDDDSLYNENIEYVEASPYNSEFVSLEVADIVIPEEEEIEDDNLREKLFNINLLIAKIEALKDNPTPSFVFLTKSYSTSPKSFLEETNTFHNSLHEFESFYFDLEEISSGNTTTHSDTSLSDYEAFYFDDDHIKEISSGSTTTHSDISLSEYDSFIFDLSNDQFPPTDRSNFTHEEFVDELAHIISPPEYDCFYFRNLPDLVEDDHFPYLAYVVWIFLAYLTYLVIPLYLHSLGNEDTIFNPGITINRFYSFKPGLSHRCGTFKKFNTHRSHLNESMMEMLFSTCFPMDQ